VLAFGIPDAECHTDIQLLAETARLFEWCQELFDLAVTRIAQVLRSRDANGFARCIGPVAPAFARLLRIPRDPPPPFKLEGFTRQEHKQPHALLEAVQSPFQRTTRAALAQSLVELRICSAS
jgi:hypothetical protein